MPSVAKADNPAQGVAVKLGTIEDLRTFVLDPKDPETPSLGDADEIKNPAITSRAIGRKRSGYGMAMDDVMLPEGQTVAGVFHDAVTNALRRSGYRVLSQGDPGYDEAAAVDVKIMRYWSWFTPGFWTVSVSNRAEAEVKSPLKGLEAGVTVNGAAEKHGMAMFESDWQDVAGKALADFEKNLQARLVQQ